MFEIGSYYEEAAHMRDLLRKYQDLDLSAWNKGSLRIKLYTYRGENGSDRGDFPEESIRFILSRENRLEMDRFFPREVYNLILNDPLVG